MNWWNKIVLMMLFVGSVFYWQINFVSANNNLIYENNQNLQAQIPKQNVNFEQIKVIQEKTIEYDGKKYSYKITQNTKTNLIGYSIEINYDYVGFYGLKEGELLDSIKNFINDVDKIEMEKKSIWADSIGFSTATGATIIGLAITGGPVGWIVVVGSLTGISGLTYIYSNDYLEIENAVWSAERNFALAKNVYQNMLLNKK